MYKFTIMKIDGLLDLILILNTFFVSLKCGSTLGINMDILYFLDFREITNSSEKNINIKIASHLVSDL